MNTRHPLNGFTLIELIIAVALVAIMATVTIPSFNAFIRNNQIQSQANEIHSLLQFARGQAVSNRRNYEVVIDNNQWIVRRVAAGANHRHERIMELNTGRANIEHNLVNNRLEFRSNGSASQAAAFISCRNNDTNSAILVRVLASGSTQMFPRGKANLTDNLTSCNP